MRSETPGPALSGAGQADRAGRPVGSSGLCAAEGDRVWALKAREFRMEMSVSPEHPKGQQNKQKCAD